MWIAVEASFMLSEPNEFNFYFKEFLFHQNVLNICMEILLIIMNTTSVFGTSICQEPIYVVWKRYLRIDWIIARRMKYLLGKMWESNVRWCYCACSHSSGNPTLLIGPKPPQS